MAVVKIKSNQLVKAINQAAKPKKVKNVKHVHQVKKDVVVTSKGAITKRGRQALDKALRDANQREIDFYTETTERYKVEGKSITIGQLGAMFNGNRISIFLANMQFRVEDIVKELKLKGYPDITNEWILNEGHWEFHSADDADIQLPDGNSAYFVFNYIEHTYALEVRGE